MSQQYPSRETIGIPSTGDPEEDERQIEAAIRHEKRIAEGMCPNGCGPLSVVNRWVAKCPACGFMLHCNTPHNLPDGR